MNQKRKMHHVWVRLRLVGVWYLVAALLVVSFVAVMSLRHNNLTALYLRDQVIQTDSQNGDTEAALRRLRLYIYSHMNTSLAGGQTAIKPPVQLKYRYERLVTAEKARVSAINTKVYSDAQTICEGLYPHGLSGGGRVPCIQAYVSTHGAKEQAIPDSLYKFDFVSPVWSPDLAGWSLVVAALLALLLAIRLALDYGLKYYLRND